jgi:hypothetical protein
MDAQRLMKEERGKLLNKWSPFLDGIKDEYIVENTAILLENEAKYLAEAGGSPGSTGQADVQGLQKIMLPIVRRVFPNLIANNIISVQPVAAPAGIIFYLKYQQGTERPGNDAGFAYDAADYPEFSMYENTAGSGEGYNPYYSTDEIGPFSGVTGAAIAINPEVRAPRNYTGTVDGAGKTTIQAIWPIQATVGAVNVDKSAILLGVVEVEGPDNFSETFSFSSLNGTAWEVRSSDRIGALVPSADITVAYAGAGTQTVTVTLGGRFASGYTGKVQVWYKSDLEFTTSIPEMRITIGNIPVAVKTRKLKAMWSQESEQDLKAYHGLSADAELTALVSNEMIAEIDREIIQKCMTIVPQSSRFTYTWDTFAANNTSGNFLDAHLGLMQVVTRTSNEVYRKSKIGPANWMIMGTKVASYVEVLKNFIPNPVTASLGMNIVKAGTYAGRFDIYKDPLFPDDKILLGHKSPQSPFGAGLVYSPYVTNLTPVIIGQDDFNPRRGFLARYGLTEVPYGNQLFASINIKNLK